MSRRTILWLVAAVALVAGQSGCRGLREYVQNGYKVGPNYCEPAILVADEWLDSTSPRLVRDTTQTQRWWRVFNDPVLERLIETAYRQNISLREAGFRVAASQYERAVAAGNLWPQSQQLFGDYFRNQRSTQTALFPRDLSFPLPPALVVRAFDNWRVGGALAWELDFWGRYRRAIEAADARLDAAVENYDDALVLLIAEVASTYVEIRTLQQRLEYAQENVELQRESARIAQARRDVAAIDAEVDAPQARSNLFQTEAAIYLLRINLRRAQNRLAVLLGMPPHDLTPLLEPPLGIPTAPPTVALEVPAVLLRRRPDVRRAERLVAAQSAAIGIAESNLYPAISISGALQVEAEDFSRLFNSQAWAGNVGPLFRWNVLNYGRLVNLIRVEDARLQQQIAAYQQTVLRANEEAENAIVGFLLLHERIALLRQSVAEAQEAARVTQAKYRAGRIEFNRVFTIEQFLVAQQDQLAQSQGDLAQSLIQLYKAVGGGWELRLEEPQAGSGFPAAVPPAPAPLPAPPPMGPTDSPPAPADQRAQTFRSPRSGEE